MRYRVITTRSGVTLKPGWDASDCREIGSTLLPALIEGRSGYGTRVKFCVAFAAEMSVLTDCFW